MKEKKTLVVLSGSGISAESGIQTFRGSDGLWNGVPVEEVCSPEGWKKNPGKVLNFYNGRRAQLGNVKPNEAHLILAQLERDFNVEIITQNVDDLHERAGSTKVLHLHGELTKVRPEDCYCKKDNYSLEYVSDIGYRSVSLGETGGPQSRQLRPHVVWFGEAVPNLSLAMQTVRKADVLLIIGTSLQVFPAAMLYTQAQDGCDIFMIDPDDSPAGMVLGVKHIKEKATVGMEKFRNIISRL